MSNALELCRATALSEPARAARQICSRQLGKALRLLDDLLDVSRLSRQGGSAERERVDMMEVIRHDVVDLELRNWGRGYVLALDVPAEAAWVRGDRLRLGQIVANLLDNSSKYSPPGGWIDVQLRSARRIGLLRIRDGGVGIRREDLARIFDPFFGCGQLAVRQEDGLGLGLALVKRLVELHGGTVEAHSGGENRCSEFIVRLPVIES